MYVSGVLPLQVNVVVMRGVNDDEIVDFVELTRSEPVNVRFIEYMPFDGNVWSDSKMVTYRDMVTRVSVVGDKASVAGDKGRAVGAGSNPAADVLCTLCSRRSV
jgi:molybdenum cofactor biosynthesis enzyme MoaA